MSDADRTPDEVRKWLAEILELAALLPDALIAGPKPDGGGSRPVPSSRPPVKLHIVSLLAAAERYDNLWEAGMCYVDPDGAGVLPYLWGWARDIEATLYEASPVLPDEVPEVPTLASVCDWLSRHAEAASVTAQWPELVYGVREVRQGLRGATAAVRDIEERAVPCPRCGDPLTHIEGETARWECPSGHETHVQAVTIGQAARIIGCGRNTLATLVNRPGLLADGIDAARPVLGDRGGRKLYDLNDLRRLHAEVKLRRIV